MLRAIVCGLMLTAFGGAARAGELDRETGPAPAGPTKIEPTAAAVAGSEMDGESPLQSHYWRRGWYGSPYGWGGSPYGWGGYAPISVSFGWGGYSPYFSPWNFGYSPAFYGYRNFAFSFGYGYRPFYPAYQPFGWGGWYW